MQLCAEFFDLSLQSRRPEIASRKNQLPSNHAAILLVAETCLSKPDDNV